ncbi:hypothetical protein [Flexivirga lutea]
MVSAPRADLPITARVQDGHATTVTFTIPEVIPPHTDSYTGFFVSVTSDFRAAYPHDGISSVPSPTRWEVTPPPGDTDVADNAVHYAGYTDQGPADIWGAVVTRIAAETVSWADGTTLRRPTTVAVKSVGPTPTPAGSRIRLATDARMSTDISVTDVTVNGVASSLTKESSSVWQGELLQVPFLLGSRLNAGDVLRLDIEYADAPSGAPASPSPGQTNFTPPDAQLNRSDQRAQELSYFTN